MSKQAIVDGVAEATGISKKDAAAVVDVIGGVIANVARGGQTARLVGLGRFNEKHKAARTGRNPQTGEQVHIAAKDVIVFKASKGA